MAIVKRADKGSELTHNELDNNFTELDQRIDGKANISHVHTIANITGLQDELDAKIDEGDVNVANGLLRLNSSTKVPCEFLTDCFDAGGKVATSHLFGGDGKVKPELLPSSICDCDQIATDILDLQTNKANRYKVVRDVISDTTISTDEDIVFITASIATFDISGTIVEGRCIKLIRYSAFDVNFNTSVLLLDGTTPLHWDDTKPNTIELVYHNSSWKQIG